MRFLISAGGTGGHIFPALSLIETIKKDPRNRFIYVGTTDRMESEIVPSMNIPYKGLEIHGYKKNIVKDAKNIFSISKAIRESKKIIDEFKPDAVVAFGGYVTLPVILASRSRKIPVYIHEQNVIPGKTNKLLSKYSKKIFISFPETKKYFKESKTVYTGNPCLERAKFIKKHDKTELGFSKSKKLILIVMGSEGSTAMNEKLLDFLRNFNESDKEILFITGRRQYNALSNNLKVPSSVKIISFYEDLPGLMKSADLIISRAGASTISEIIGTNIPSILIPSPYVANNHQYYNALSLKDLGVSIMIEQSDLTPELLLTSIKSILDNKKEYDDIVKKIEFMEKPESSTKIYNEIIKTK